MAREQKTLLNVGCGPRGSGRLPRFFGEWREVRVDIDAAVAPDVIADLTDLSAFADGSADAIWAAHCLEHLYQHQVRRALSEFRRVLRVSGFLCVLVPDLQTAAQYAAGDRFDESLYDSPAGPVTAHDMFFGLGAAIAQGHTTMAHRCGFTPSVLQNCFDGVPFAEVVLRRRARTLELAAVARPAPASDEMERNALLQGLEL